MRSRLSVKAVLFGGTDNKLLKRHRAEPMTIDVYRFDN